MSTRKVAMGQKGILVDRTLLNHLSTLCRIDLPVDVEAFLDRLNTTLAYAKKIDELDLTCLEPFSYPLHCGIISQKLLLRPDTIQESLLQQETLQNAPDRELCFFKVHKVIDSP